MSSGMETSPFAILLTRVCNCFIRHNASCGEENIITVQELSFSCLIDIFFFFLDTKTGFHVNTHGIYGDNCINHVCND